MRISVNLATRPFVELRPFFLRLRLVMVLLVLAGIGAVVAAHLLQKQLDRAQARMTGLQDQMFAVQQEKLHNQQRMREPQNAAVLERAHFLNALFLHKSFSWTAVMMDLETVLPAGVQVTSIEPQVAGNGDVVIRLRVSGDRDRAVQLVRNLERSRRFLRPRLMGESVQAHGAGQGNAAPGASGAVPGSAPGTAANPAANATPAGVEFEILANYNPLPAGQPFSHPARAKAALVEEPQQPGVSRREQAAGSGRYGVVLKPHSPTRPAASRASGPALSGAQPARAQGGAQ